MPVQGARRLARTLIAIGREVDKQVAAELINQARTLQGRAVAVAPELTRRLILSSRVDKRVRRGQTVAVVSFDTPYAVLRHEDFYNLGPISAAKSPTQDGAPGRKYLQRPFDNMTDGIEQAIGEIPNQVARAAFRRRRR